MAYAYSIDDGERAMEDCGSVTLCHHCGSVTLCHHCSDKLTMGHEIERLLAALIAVESAFAQKCADTWCTSRNAETLETARAAIAAAGGKVSRNTDPER